MEILYKTDLGRAYWGDSLELMKSLCPESVDLVMTSPPFALRKKKSYGNVSASEYGDWFQPFADAIWRVLKPTGSFVIDIGGSWNRGEPTRSLYHYDLLLRLCTPRGRFRLAQEFFWFNPAKMPSPAQWVTIKRVRVKDAVNTLWWLSKTNSPKADNTRILKPYTRAMEDLLARGYNAGQRPSGHVVSQKWSRRHVGAIPPNLITAANTRSTDDYLRGCRKHGLPVHPARFVPEIPKLFVAFLTEPGDLVLDPFAGSNVVGQVAEKLGRKWLSADVSKPFVVGSAFRFGADGEEIAIAHVLAERWRDEVSAPSGGALQGRKVSAS